MVQLLYRAGLRSLECTRLRVKDVDFSRRVITAQDTKRGNGLLGQKDVAHNNGREFLSVPSEYFVVITPRKTGSVEILCTCWLRVEC
jgi:integrase